VNLDAGSVDLPFNGCRNALAHCAGNAFRRICQHWLHGPKDLELILGEPGLTIA
jgi:hypothetical protein